MNAAQGRKLRWTLKSLGQKDYGFELGNLKLAAKIQVGGKSQVLRGTRPEAAGHTQDYVFEMLEDGLVEILTSLQTTKS